MRLLLPRQNLKPRSPKVLLSPSVAELREVFPPENRHQLWAVDCETTGLNAHENDNCIFGLGFANAVGCFYVDLRSLETSALEFLRDYLRTAPMVMFNAFFDAAFLQRWLGCYPNVQWDTYALYKNLSSEGYAGQSWSLESAQLEVLGWDGSNKGVLAAALAEVGLGKGDMYKLPAQLVGEYCAADADSTWQLYAHLTDVAAQWPSLADYHQRLFLTEVRLLVEQQFAGITIDKNRLYACHAELLARIEQAMNAFLNNRDVAPHLVAHRDSVREAWMASQPPQTKGDGTVSKRWELWRDREASYLAANEFNPNSKDMLAWLFYDCLGNAVLRKTATGKRAVDRKILPLMGEPGKQLTEYNVLVKRRGYVEAVIAKSAADGLLHPQFKTVGTVTTRLGGIGGLNLQQMPKDPAFLAAFVAPPGHKLVQLDAAALEPVLLAGFSRDPALLSLYGPGAKPNDVYLFVGSRFPKLGDKIRRYYDPANPTPDGIAAAKKHAKNERFIAKVVQLSSTYGAGPRKIHETLQFAGVDLTLREVQDIYRAYWELFAGVRRWERQLKTMWERTGGWLPTILGTPVCVPEELLKDCVSRVVQTSGHQWLQVWLWHIDRMRRERGITMTPYLVDNHDESIWAVPNAQAEAAAQLLSDAVTAANEEIGLDIPITGKPEIVDNLAQVKCSETYDAWLESLEEDAA